MIRELPTLGLVHPLRQLLVCNVGSELLDLVWELLQHLCRRSIVSYRRTRLLLLSLRRRTWRCAHSIHSSSLRCSEGSLSSRDASRREGFLAMTGIEMLLLLLLDMISLLLKQLLLNQVLLELLIRLLC